jgi:hypothetical protein
MGRTTLSKPISLRLSPQVRDKVKRLSESTHLLQAQIYDLILKASCEALEEGTDGEELPLPLKFQLAKKKKNQQEHE